MEPITAEKFAFPFAFWYIARLFAAGAHSQTSEAAFRSDLPGFAGQRAANLLALTSNGKVRYQLKTPYRDGTTHVIFEPLDFMARLAALVPNQESTWPDTMVYLRPTANTGSK